MLKSAENKTSMKHPSSSTCNNGTHKLLFHQVHYTMQYRKCVQNRNSTVLLPFKNFHCQLVSVCCLEEKTAITVSVFYERIMTYKPAIKNTYDNLTTYLKAKSYVTATVMFQQAHAVKTVTSTDSMRQDQACSRCARTEYNSTTPNAYILQFEQICLALTCGVLAETMVAVTLISQIYGHHVGTGIPH